MLAACGLLGLRVLLEPLLHALQQIDIRLDSLVVAQVQAGDDLRLVLHRPHHLLPLGVEVDLGVPGEQRLQLFIVVARMQQRTRAVAHQFAQRLALCPGPSPLAQQFIQREHPLPARSRQLGLQRQQHLRVRLTEQSNVLVPRRHRLARLLDLPDQRVEALVLRRQRRCGVARRDLQCLAGHGAVPVRRRHCR